MNADEPPTERRRADLAERAAKYHADPAAGASVDEVRSRLLGPRIVSPRPQLTGPRERPPRP